MLESRRVLLQVGPGLAPCLHAGLNAAHVLCAQLGGALLLPVHHLEAHILVARMRTSGLAPSASPIAAPSASPMAAPFPFLSLLVSGGHCQLVAASSFGAAAHPRQIESSNAKQPECAHARVGCACVRACVRAHACRHRVKDGEGR